MKTSIKLTFITFAIAIIAAACDSKKATTVSDTTKTDSAAITTDSAKTDKAAVTVDSLKKDSVKK